MSLDTPRSVKAKGQYAASRNLGGLFTWTIDQDNGVLVNAAREGLGYEIDTQTIDMKPFYFEGINVAEPDNSGGDSEPQPTVNHAPVAAIQLRVVGGSRIQLSGEASHDDDNDALSFSWGVPGTITVADKSAAVIEFDVPVVTQSTDYQFTLFVRDTKNEPSSQQRFVVTAVPGNVPAGGDTPVPQPTPEPTPDPTPTPTPTPTPDTGSAPYPLWDAGTIYGAKWGSFEKVSWKGHNYQVNWYSQGEQPDLNCGPYQVWTDIGTY